MKKGELQVRKGISDRIIGRRRRFCCATGAALAIGLMGSVVRAQYIDLYDADGDRLSNLMEYALGTDPADSTDANAALYVKTVQEGGSRYLALDYKRRTDAASLQLQYLPEVSGDKQVWYSDPAHVVEKSVVKAEEVGFVWVTVRDKTPLADTGSRFIRLRVNQVQSTKYLRTRKLLLPQEPTTTAISPAFVGSATLIGGDVGLGSRWSLFSQRGIGPLILAGKASHVRGAELVDTKAKWLEGQFGTNGLPSYVEFDNGRIVDVCHCVASSQSLCLACSLEGMVSPGDCYRLRVHRTVSSIFGPENESGLKAGESAAQADEILLVSQQLTKSIFYYSNQFYHGWVDGGLSPADNEVIAPHQAVMVLRKAPEARTLFLTGIVRTGPMTISVVPGYNALGTLRSASVALHKLNLYTGDPTTGFVPGQSITKSDNLMMVNPDGSTTTYFYYQMPGVYEGWVDGALNPADDTLIPPGSAIFIKRLSASVSFDWSIPAD